MLHSDFRKLCEVRLPFSGRQKYMHTFDLAGPVMPIGLQDYLGPVIALCSAAGGGWLHGCNNIPLDEFKRMPVIVASSAIGCRAWRGQFDTQPKSDGDLSHLNLDGGEVLPANIGFLLSPDCVHESMIQPVAVRRTFLRIALPVDFKF